MSNHEKSLTSADVRGRLNHPVIDTDGHSIEIGPLLDDYVREVGGADFARRLAATPRRQTRRTWWVPTANTVDRATAMLPRMMAERLDAFGIDYSILYPTIGIGSPYIADAEVRRVMCRAANRYYADMYGGFEDRLTHAAVIPMETPEEAIEELDYAVGVLGHKVVMMEGYGRRNMRDIAEPSGEFMVGRPDVFALESDYDYDPVWAKCVELKVAPTFHQPSMGFGFRMSNVYMYNHIGHFAAAAEALSKALFFGGVTQRFPELRFGFLECGVGWACGLYGDLVDRWKKRGAHVIDRLDPANIDREAFLDYVSKYGSERILAKMTEIRSIVFEESAPNQRDDFALAGISSPEDVRERFVDKFFFGCEADDGLNALAFDRKINPLGARLGAMFGSDISHWDVADATEPVREAYELVEDEFLGEEDFRDFMFGNAARLHGSLNPDFFRNSRIEQEVDVLGISGLHSENCVAPESVSAGGTVK